MAATSRLRSTGRGLPCATGSARSRFVGRGRRCPRRPEGRWWRRGHRDEQHERLADHRHESTHPRTPLPHGVTNPGPQVTSPCVVPPRLPYRAYSRGRNHRWSSSERSERQTRPGAVRRKATATTGGRAASEASGQTRPSAVRRRRPQPQVVEQRAKRANRRDQVPYAGRQPQPPVVEQRAKRAIRRDQVPYAGRRPQPPVVEQRAKRAIRRDQVPYVGRQPEPPWVEQLLRPADGPRAGAGRD